MTNNSSYKIKKGKRKCRCLHCGEEKLVTIIEISINGKFKKLNGPVNCCSECLEENWFILSRVITSQFRQITI